MEVLKLSLLVTVLIVTINRTLSIDDVPEFQYPCYIDVCTFPKQYCNSEERICSPCSRALCHAPKVPTACRYICIKYDELSTTQPPTTQTVTTALNHAGDDNDTTLLFGVIFSTTATTVLTVLLILVILHFYRKAKRAKQNYTVEKNNGGNTYSRVEQGQEVVPITGNSVIQEPNQAMNVCLSCGQNARRDPYPENHQTNIPPSSLSSPPSYKALDSRTNMRPYPPIVDTPTDSGNSIESTPNVVTNNTRHQEAAAGTASTEGDSLMHMKPWNNSKPIDVELQSLMIDNFNSNQNSDDTSRKVPNV